MNHDMSSTPNQKSFEFQRSCKKKEKSGFVVGLMRDDDNKTHLSYANFTYSKRSYKCTIHYITHVKRQIAS